LYVSHLGKKLAGDESRSHNPQHKLWYPFGLLPRQAFVQVEAYLTKEGIKLADVQALITILEMAFRERDCHATAESKSVILKRINCNIYTCFADFQHHAVDNQ
jgi:hypothetical protein